MNVGWLGRDAEHSVKLFASYSGQFPGKVMEINHYFLAHSLQLGQAFWRNAESGRDQRLTNIC